MLVINCLGEKVACFPRRREHNEGKKSNISRTFEHGKVAKPIMTQIKLSHGTQHTQNLVTSTLIK